MGRLLPIFAITLALLIGCTSTAMTERIPIDGNTNPTMVTKDVNSFVSDSGVTRYHMTAPVWYMYDEADDPFWHFPEGLTVERYNDEMEVESIVTADTARYMSRKKLWKMTGDVRMRNTDGDKFLTRELYWDQNSHKVFSDSFIHIERGQRILEGYGFISDEQITSYTIRRPSGIIPTATFEANRQQEQP